MASKESERERKREREREALRLAFLRFGRTRRDPLEHSQSILQCIRNLPHMWYTVSKVEHRRQPHDIVSDPIITNKNS